MFQFIVEGKGAGGKERMQRALRRMKAVVLKGTTEINKAQKQILERVRETERQRKRLEEERQEENNLILIGHL